MTRTKALVFFFACVALVAVIVFTKLDGAIARLAVYYNDKTTP